MNNRLHLRLVANLLILGLCGIVAQTVLLRELLVLFGGNELTLGVIIGAWVLFEALGALAAGRLAMGRDSLPRIFTTVTILFAIAFPLAVWLARSYKGLAGIPPEIGVGIGTTMVASSLVMLPVGLLHGFLFIAGSLLFKGDDHEAATAAGEAYAWETIGTLFGGIVASYLLITAMEPFQTCFLAAFVSIALCLVIPGQRGVARWLPIPFLVAIPILWMADIPGQLQKLSIARQWQGKEVVVSRNSLYQNLTVTRSGDELTFFSDGQPLLTTPTPDIAAMEELVHIPLLALPAPRSVLVLAGGSGGIIAEILKHPTIQRVDSLEIDPVLLKLLRDHPTRLTVQELSDRRVRILPRDPRPFLRETRERYDLVIINHSIPQTLLANRLFTRECLADIRTVLTNGGLLAIPWSGSGTYYNPELKRLDASLLGTMNGVFAASTMIPGDTNLVLAGDRRPNLDPALLSRRLEERKLLVSLINRQHLEYRLDPLQISWLKQELAGVVTGINLDLAPQGLHYAMAYRNLIFSPWLNSILGWVAGLPLHYYLIGALLLFASLWILSGASPTLPVIAAIGATGVTAMLLELFLIFAFQVAFGQLYHAAALLIVSLMGGLAAGSLLMTRFISGKRDEKRLFIRLEGGLVLYSAILAGLFIYLGSSATTGGKLLYAGYPMMLVIAGLLAGAQFPLAVRIHGKIKERGPAGRIEGAGVGIIYGIDLAGACIGGVLGGVIILPLCGLVNGAIMVALLKLGTLILMSRTAGKRGER